MDIKNDYLYPVTKETLHRYASDVFRPITRGECVTTVWVPMAGRRMWNKFIIENIHLFEKELPHFENYLLVYIEPLDLTEESVAGYLRLMAKSFIDVAKNNKKIGEEVLKDTAVFDDPGTTYSKLLEKLKELLQQSTESGLDVVFFVGEFDELTFANKIFYNNLKSLWSGLYPRLHYVFLMREYVVRDSKLESWGDFNEAILQNIIYVPILSGVDLKYSIDRMSNQLNINLNQDQYSQLIKWCGGHPYMLRVALRLLKSLDGDAVDLEKFEKAVTGNYELKSVARGVFEVLTQNQKELLEDIANGEQIKSLEGDELKSLEKLGFITVNNLGNYKLYGDLFKEAINHSSDKHKENRHGKRTLELEGNSGNILYNGKQIEEKFTSQEYTVLAFMLHRMDRICSRDEIGNILWGKESYEKYSDWAIDQLISKIRKKLTGLTVKNKLLTIRGKGYKLVTPELIK